MEVQVSFIESSICIFANSPITCPLAGGKLHLSPAEAASLAASASHDIMHQVLRS